MNTTYKGVDGILGTCYIGIVSTSVRPNPESISQGEWARFIFVAGRLCIDFTQTGGETGKRASWERFHRPSDLADWLSISPLQLQGIQVAAEEFSIALSLRESIWRVAEAIRQNETPLTQDVDTINRVAAQPDLPPQLLLDSYNQVWRCPTPAAEALSTIARDAIDLFSQKQETFMNIR